MSAIPPRFPRFPIFALCTGDHVAESRPQDAPVQAGVLLVGREVALVHEKRVVFRTRATTEIGKFLSRLADGTVLDVWLDTPIAIRALYIPAKIALWLSLRGLANGREAFQASRAAAKRGLLWVKVRR